MWQREKFARLFTFITILSDFRAYQFCGELWHWELVDSLGILTRGRVGPFVL